MLVSIVIPAYLTTPHHAALLDETLGTVDAQSWRNYEVIVVDDGSPLAAGPIVERHPSARTLRQPNGGSAVARNTGIAEARGHYLVFLDADDHLLPPALEAGVERLEAHPECGWAIGAREEMTWEGGPVTWSVPGMPQESRLYETLLSFDWYIIPPSSAMFRRRVVEEVGGFRNPWGADDLDFYLRVAHRHPAVCYDRPPVTRYRRYSASSSRDGERMLRSIRVVYERQREVVRGDPAAEAAFRRGLGRLTEIFRDCLIENVEDRVRARQWRRAGRAAMLLARESPARLPAAARRAARALGARA